MLDSVQEVIDSAQAGKVFGEPIERDGMTVLPVAKIRGGGGGGGGGHAHGEHGEHGAHGREGGGGAGVGVMARPMGVYVIRGGKVNWQPAVDVNKVILGGQVVLALGLMTLRTYLRRRRR